MPARYLYPWADDKPHLQKQIGCITGIFQLLDRQHILTGRRPGGQSPKRLPSGCSHFSNGTFEEKNLCHWPAVAEKSSRKTVKEKQRVSMESSRASFSSYSRSSFFSSPNSDGTAQPQPLSFNQSSSSSQFGRQSLDLPDEVRDNSVYRKDGRLPVGTVTKEETAESAVLNYENSPRPLQLSKSVNGSLSLEFQEASSRTSCRLKDGYVFSVQKDAHRLSYDGRYLSRLSFESRDSFKLTPKLKESPRLSLDSTHGSVSSPKYDSRSDFVIKKWLRDGETQPPNVVAKLMGLETPPDSALVSDSHSEFLKTCQVEHCEPFPRSLKPTDPCLSFRTSTSSRDLWNESGSRKNPESVKEVISRLPIEPAPWKLLGGTSQKPDVKHLVKKLERATPSFPSAYFEFEKKLKDLKISQSGKDLRALKQLIDAMQAKGLLDSRREEQDLKIFNKKDYEPQYGNQHLSAGLVNKQKLPSDSVNSFTNKGGSSLRTIESKIVIMKPAKLVEKSDILASSVTQLDCLSSLPKLHGEYGESRKSTATYRSSKKQIQKNGNAVSSSYENKTKFTSMSSPRLKESTIGLVKSSGLESPRLQQKELELDKQCRPPIAPDSSKSRRQPKNQLPELGSPGGKCRPKSTTLRRIDNQCSDISTETGNLSYQQDDCCMQSDANIVMKSAIDKNFPYLDSCAESNGSQSPSVKNAKYLASCLVKKKLGPVLSEDGGLPELALVASEHPSLVSVLDYTVYKDDALSPVKQKPDILRAGAGSMNSNSNSSRKQLDSAENLMTYHTGYPHNPQINRKRLERIEHLVKKLRQLNSTHDETQTDYIASLCETSNPDHRYIAEILLASGFLLRDLNSTLTNFQHHPLGLVINPQLFLVLEQTKSSTLHGQECSIRKPEKDKFHRKLIFDAVAEILVGKLDSGGHSHEPWLRPEKQARKYLNAQKLLRGVCLEIEQLQAKKSGCGFEENKEDSLKSILGEDLVHPVENWTNFPSEISGTVLDVERLIFKALVDEIVYGEAVGLRIKPGRKLYL